MKKIFLGFTVLSAIVIFASCLKSKDPGCPYTERVAYAHDTIVAKLKHYLDSTNVTNYSKDTSGVFYKVITPGTGDTAGVCSLATVYYKGMLLNGTVFDQTSTTPASFTVGDLIVGFQKGMKYIGKGGKIRFYIPYPLAYGNEEVRNPNTNAVVIPAKSHLMFDVELLEVQ